MILAIDPGPVRSAYAFLGEDLRILDAVIMENDELEENIIQQNIGKVEHFAIEMIASYGMPVGAEVFETCVWIGRFISAAGMPYKYIYRKEEKMNLCGSMKAKDSNIRQALIDRFGPVGTKKAPGWFYGVSKDMWAAAAVGVTYHDLYMRG